MTCDIVIRVQWSAKICGTLNCSLEQSFLCERCRWHITQPQCLNSPRPASLGPSPGSLWFRDPSARTRRRGGACWAWTPPWWWWSWVRGWRGRAWSGRLWDKHQCWSFGINGVFRQRRHLRAYRRHHTGSGGCWGRGEAELSDTNTEESTACLAQFVWVEDSDIISREWSSLCADQRSDFWWRPTEKRQRLTFINGSPSSKRLKHTLINILFII